MLTMELKHAERMHDFSNVHRLSRRLSKKKIRPTRRVFGRAHARRLSISEWEEALVKPGKEGGQLAMKIDFEEQQQQLL